MRDYDKIVQVRPGEYVTSDTLAEKSMPELEALEDQLSRSVSYAGEMAVRLENLGDRLFGSQVLVSGTANPRGEGPVPNPPGVVARLDYRASDINNALNRLSSAIDRLARLA